MKDPQKLKVFTLHYKPGSEIISEDPNYINIWAGKNNGSEETVLLGDDSGDHISEKNKYYSELTGLYWIWKNTKQDITGSCHYRRFFTAQDEPVQYKIKRNFYYLAGIWKKRYGLIYTSQPHKWKNKILSSREIEDILKDYEAIMPVRRILRYSIKEHYARYHDIKDLELARNILEKDYPEYVKTFDQVMAGYRLFANNMFILNEERFDSLMAWLFDIFSKFEDQINLKDYKNYQQRIIGFLSERLITVWIYHNNINYKELPLIYFKKLKK